MNYGSHDKLQERKILEGENFQLIPLTEEHISEKYLRWLNDSEINQFLEVRFVRQTRDTIRNYISSFYQDTESNPSKYIWGIYTKEGDHHSLVGTATLSQINLNHGSAEIGLLVGEKEYWGKNASVQALALVIKFAFETLKLRRLTGGSYAPNHGMNFTFKRLGFRNEAKLVQAFCVGKNTYVDGYRWALLKEEWKDRTTP